MRIDYEHYRDARLILGLVGVTLVALVAVLLVGPEINGTHRWFAVAGVGIQPSELAKLAMILFTAAVLERRMDRIGEPRYALGPIVRRARADAGAHPARSRTSAAPWRCWPSWP